MSDITIDASYSNYAHAYAQITVTSSAALLSALLPTNMVIPTWATMAFITPESGSIRYRCDGVAPTSSVGQIIASGQNWPLQGITSLANCVLIALGSTTVSVEFRG